jgi:hypothetical protein
MAGIELAYGWSRLMFKHKEEKRNPWGAVDLGWEIDRS